MCHNYYPFKLNILLISSDQLRSVLPLARVFDARPSYPGLQPLESGAKFLFVPIIRLADVLGRFILPIISLEK